MLNRLTFDVKDFFRNGRFPFISIEGTDGSGKTITTKALAARHGGAFLTTPPEELRIVRHHFDEKVSSWTRLLFYLASVGLASDQARELTRSRLVLCDRYYHTTLVYHLADNLPGDVAGLIEASSFFEPDIVFCLDCSDSYERARRLAERGLTFNDRRFASLQEKAGALYRSTPGLIHIDTSTFTPEQVVEAVETKIASHFRLDR